MTPVIEGGDIIEPWRSHARPHRGQGRDEARHDDEVAITAGTMLDERWIRRLEELEYRRYRPGALRSPITCETRHGICATCYGRDLARGHKVNIGEAIGVVAAQSIGEPGTQLTMRTFHIGGAASRATAQDNIQIKATTVRCAAQREDRAPPDGTLVAVSRSGELSILDKVGRERERYKLPYGAIIKVVNDDDHGDRRQIVATWDPHTHPIITEVAGTVKFSGMDEGITVKRQTDELTGLSSIEVMEAGSARRRARTCARRSRWSMRRARS
jgi:DNA-directed RNA polymerase subunit beta'